MSVQFTLNDSAYPPSGAFLDFVVSYLQRKPYCDTDWLDQVSEGFTSGNLHVDKQASRNACIVMSSDAGREIIGLLYNVLGWILAHDTRRLKQFFHSVKFVYIVGAPRTGGTFLLNRLSQHYAMKCGYQSSHLPAFVVHDGSPGIYPSVSLPAVDVLARNVMQLAEFCVAVKLFYDLPKKSVVCVKKMLRYAFAGDFLDSVLGFPEITYVTVRHPCSISASVLDKCGIRSDSHHPAVFKIRCAIDQLVYDTLRGRGDQPAYIFSLTHAAAYVAFWGLFYTSLCSSLGYSRCFQFVKFGPDLAALPARLKLKVSPGVSMSEFVFPSVGACVCSDSDIICADKTITAVAEFWRRRCPGFEFPSPAFL